MRFTVRCLLEEEWEFSHPHLPHQGVSLQIRFSWDTFIPCKVSSASMEVGSLTLCWDGFYCPLLQRWRWQRCRTHLPLPGSAFLPFSIPIHWMVRTSHISGLHELVLTHPGLFMGVNGSGGLCSFPAHQCQDSLIKGLWT